MEKQKNEERLKQAAKVVLFLFIFFLLLKTVTYIIRTDGDVKNRFAGFYAEKDNSIDVIFIGSSPVHPYYVFPKLYGEYGLVCYPLSSYQQRPKAAPYLVKEAEKTQEPKLWVFELRQYLAEESVMTENLAHTRGLTDNMKYSWNRIALINELIDDPAERYTYYFDIFKYHSNWKTMVLPRQLACFQYEVNDFRKGFLYEDGIQESAYNDVTQVTDTMPMLEDKEKTLRELLDFLTEKKEQALFIVSPYLLTDEMQMKFNYMEEIVREYGYDFLNLNNYCEEIGMNYKEDFYDGGSHANIYGANKCTDFLGQYLKEHYELEDRRESEGYDSWDTAYRLWLEQKKESETLKEKP